MALFNIDIERFYNLNKEQGLDLKGIACIQYPIYYLHCEIGDLTPDPLDSLDKSIAKIINDVTSNDLDISNLLGVPLSGIQTRLNYFSEYGYLNDSNIGLSQLGFNSLILCEEKLIRKKSHDFIIDGITFNPLNGIFYSRNYKQFLIEELGFTTFTNNKGEIETVSSFAPNIVHTPFDQDKSINLIIDKTNDERELLNIPIGLVSINNVSFTKMTFPILVGLFDKGGVPTKILIDGFKVLGDSDHLIQMGENLRERIDNLEFRLNVARNKNTNEVTGVYFQSNWGEIDNKLDDNKLFWISKEDLKVAFEKNYSLQNLSLDDVVSDQNNLILNISKSTLINTSNRRLLINNLKRGRDYKMSPSFLNSGVWITFFSFVSGDKFVNDLIDILEFIDKTHNKSDVTEQILKKMESYPDFREMLTFLEEYELLESIDIKLNMFDLNQNGK
jgi:hypothetical protein